MDASRIVIAGGSGLMGGVLKAHFENQGREVVVLSRSEGKGQVKWDGKTQGIWSNSLEGADAVINLCGKPVVNRWTKRNMRAYEDSRIDPTEAIGEAVRKASTPPKVWINASAIGYYGESGSREVSEASRAGNDFLAQLCVRWERACLRHDTPSTRKVCLRLGVLLHKDADFVKATRLVTKLFLGSALGNGRQYVSWLHAHDLARIVEWCLFEPVTGALNACSPNPVTNAEYMAHLRAIYGRPPVPPVPAPLVRLVVGLIGKEPGLLLTGQRAIPEIALARGFKFRFEDIALALEDLLDAYPQAWKTA